MAQTGTTVTITSVAPGSGATRAGIQVNDVLAALDNVPVVSVAQLTGLIHSRRPGEQIRVTLLRNGQSLRVTATLTAD